MQQSGPGDTSSQRERVCRANKKQKELIHAAAADPTRLRLVLRKGKGSCTDVYTAGVRGTAVLQQQPDPIYVQVLYIQQILRAAGYHSILLPSCRPELNFIGGLWLQHA